MSSLSATTRQESCFELENGLPTPVPHTRQRHELRLHTAIEAFDALAPGNADEARLAVQIVLCGAHATDCLREAGLFPDDFAKRCRCRAQAASLQRESRAARRILAREQKQRLALEAVAGGVAVQPTPRPAASHAVQTRAAAAPAQAVSVAQTAAPPPPPTPLPAGPDTTPPPTQAAPAMAAVFAQQHVLAAAQIREDRGITPKTRALFPDAVAAASPEAIDAVVRGTSPMLRLLDEVCQEHQQAA